MTYEQFKDALFTQARAYGFTDFELYYTASDSFNAEVFQGEIAKYENTSETGLSFRGTYKGRVGYAYTEKMDESLIASLVARAAENAGIIEEEEIEKLYPGDDSYPPAKGYNPVLDGFTAAEKIDLALALEKYALGLDARVKSVDYCVVCTAEGVTRIANSYGLDVRYPVNMIEMALDVRVEENGVTKTAYDFWAGNDAAEATRHYKKLADTTVRDALAMLGASGAASGAYDAVFHHDAARSLFGVFLGVFFAENAQKGFSLLAGKTGTTIAADCVTLRDDAGCERCFINVPFDSEGAATKDKAVVENGVFKTLLYNTKTAAKDGTATTGNGFKPGFRGAVGTAITNFYMVPTEKSREELLADISDGLFITGLSGLHAGANAVSGDFSLMAEGFVVTDGQIGRPVEQITVAGNFYTLLKDICAVGGDLRFGAPGAGGALGMPSFAVKGLRVSGL